MKIAIVENEEKDRSVYREFIAKYQDESKERIDAIFFSNGVDIVTDYPDRLDAVFMDVDMPMMNGLETSIKIREKDDDVIIIFVTNLSEYAIQGYKVHALDFLLKPIQYNDFKFEIEKVKRNSKIKEIDSLWIVEKGNTIRIPFKFISSIEILHHDVIIHTVDDKGNKFEHRFRGSLQAIEEKIDKSSFYRINNYSLINLAYVKQVRKDDVVLSDNQAYPFSRNRKKGFMDVFTFYMNGDMR